MFQLFMVSVVALLVIANSAIAQNSVNQIAPQQWISGHYIDHPLVGKMFNAKGKEVPQKVFPLLAQRSKFTLLGEIHDNPDHHLIQAAIINAVGKSGRKPSIVFEMVPRSLSEEINLYDLANDPQLDAFAKRLEWEKRGWYSWDIYRPVALAAANNNLRMVAGNIDREVSRKISKDGIATLGAARVTAFRLDHPLPEKTKNSLRTELDESHCGLLPKSALPSMINVQRARDGSLSNALLTSGRQYGAILIAGNGHVRKDRGVPYVLSQLLPGSQVVTINRGVSPETGKPVDLEVRIPNAKNLALGILEVDPKRQSLNDYELQDSDGAPLFDYVIFTPKFDITDHCAAMRKQFGKPKEEKND